MRNAKEAKENACMIIHDGREICILPSEAVLRLIGKKYTLLIIGLLGNEKSMHFNQILRSIGAMRSNLVSQRFRELEAAGLVERRIINTRPVGVEYSLTARGMELRAQLIPLFDWIEKSSAFKTVR
jgi:DNA-binding HxlR family transcriptional regulator